jgi:hypothetical protein
MHLRFLLPNSLLHHLELLQSVKFWDTKITQLNSLPHSNKNSNSISIYKKTSPLLRLPGSSLCCLCLYQHSIQSHLCTSTQFPWQLFSTGPHQNSPSCFISDTKASPIIISKLLLHVSITQFQSHCHVRVLVLATPHLSFEHADFVNPYCVHVIEYPSLGNLGKRLARSEDQVAVHLTNNPKVQFKVTIVKT